MYICIYQFVNLTIIPFSDMIKYVLSTMKISITSPGEVSGRVSVRIESSVPGKTVSLSVVIVGVEPRVDHTVRSETGAFFRHPLRQRRYGVSTFVPSPAVPVPFASPLLPGKTIGLHLRTRAFHCQALVLRRERSVLHRMHPVVQMRIRAYKEMNTDECSYRRTRILNVSSFISNLATPIEKTHAPLRKKRNFRDNRTCTFTIIRNYLPSRSIDLEGKNRRLFVFARVRDRATSRRARVRGISRMKLWMKSSA